MRKLFEKHKIIFEICLTIIALPITWLIIFPICKRLGLNYQYTQAVGFLASLLVAVGLTKIVYKDQLYQFKKVPFDKPVLKYGWLGFVGAIGAFLSTGNEIDLSPTVDIFLGYILMNLMVAITEEVIFRKIFLGLLVDNEDSFKSRLWRAIIIAAVIFGLRHMFNLMLYPNQIVTCSFQSVAAACAAIYLTGMYFVTGSIIPGIIIHFLEDMGVTAMEMYSSKTWEASTLDITVPEGFAVVLIQIPYVICGIIMIRRYIEKVEKGEQA